MPLFLEFTFPFPLFRRNRKFSACGHPVSSAVLPSPQRSWTVPRSVPISSFFSAFRPMGRQKVSCYNRVIREQSRQNVRREFCMPFLFFWCLFLCAIDAYLVFAYKTDLTETFQQKMAYFLGGHIAFVYNLCFP